MRTRYFITLSLLLVCSVISPTGLEGSAQLFINDKPADSPRFIEKLYIQTDRDIYISGEEIRMKIYKLNGFSGSPDNFSKVVYIELLNKQYNPVSQIKTLIYESSGSATLNLSDTLSTGEYLICAYTRWMLNFPGNRNAYRPVYIINPFRKIDYVFPEGETLPVNSVSSSPEELKGIPEPEIHKNAKEGVNIEITTGTDHFRERENVVLDVSVKDLQGKPVNADMSVSVVRSSLVFNELSGDTNVSPGEEVNSDFRESPENMPELEGEIITGTLRNKMTGEPFSKAGMSLSFVGKKCRTQFSETDDNGRFVFIVKDHVGFGEMVIQPLSVEFNDAFIDLEQPFSTVSDEFHFSFPAIDSVRLEGINKAIVSMQVNTIYKQLQQQHPVTHDSTAGQDFYGEASRRITLSEYIELKDIREVLKEIIPEVKFVRRNKQAGLKVINANPFEVFNNMALVLIDGVPVLNIEAVLDLDASLFESIDIINTRYFFKRSVFDGIVSFVTRKGNLDVLGYENFFFRQVYEGFKENRAFESPDYSSDSLKFSRIPDFRNTVFWNPDLSSADSGNAQVRFYSPDEKGEYTVVIEGITEDGSYGITRMPLWVY
jgi:hypothetical protein